MKKFKKLTWRGETCLYVTNEQETIFVNVTNPMMSFKKGEAKFTAEDIEIIKDRRFDYEGQKVRIVPRMYGNGFLAVTVVPDDEPEDYCEVITVNLEMMDAISIPCIIWADINNCPDSVKFLKETGLAKDTGHTRGSGFVNYPVMIIDLVMAYALNPEIFENCPLVPDPEDCLEDEDDEDNE